MVYVKYAACILYFISDSTWVQIQNLHVIDNKVKKPRPKQKQFTQNHKVEPGLAASKCKLPDTLTLNFSFLLHLTDVLTIKFATDTVFPNPKKSVISIFPLFGFIVVNSLLTAFISYDIHSQVYLFIFHYPGSLEMKDKKPENFIFASFFVCDFVNFFIFKIK